MQAAQDYGQPDDDLATLAATGDENAFAALFERHFDGIYDLALRTARRPEAATAAVQNTFMKAWENLQKGKVGPDVKVWLYATARQNAIDHARYKRATVEREMQGEAGIAPRDFAQMDTSASAGADAALEDEEMINLVWASVASMSPKQYSLLDLHLRRRFTAEELAEGLHLTTGMIYTMLTRLRDALTESVTYVLLMRRGRRNCPDLDMLLSDMLTIEYTQKTRRLIKRHLRTCERCQVAKRRFASPLEVFAGLAPVPAPVAVKTGIWQNVSSLINGLPLAPGEPVRGRGRPVLIPDSPLRAAAIIGGAMTIVIALIAGMLALTGGGGGSGNVELQDPSDVRATDREPGESSTDDTIEIEWTEVPGARAYSILWSEEAREVPDTEADLPGTATSTTSPSLEPGIWYFHLRTQGDNGQWTSTVHVGPFEVVSAASPSPTSAASPSPTERATPEPTPNFGTPTPGVETPAATPEPTPVPTAAPTPTQSPPPPTQTQTPAPTDSPAPQAEQ